MSKQVTFFADTTVVYYRLHSHALLQAEAAQANRDGVVRVSNFVRGEYIRGYVVGLIELFCAIREERSVSDGIHWFNAQMGMRQPRKVANALGAICGALQGLEDWTNVAKTLRRLGEEIRGSLLRFDMTFIYKANDPLRCDIGILTFPQETYAEQHILDFAAEYGSARQKPSCDQCRFRQEQLERLTAEGVDLYSAGQQAAHKEHKGYVRQAKMAATAAASKRTGPSCWYCDRLGDTIIALSAPTGSVILTGDAQSFRALAGLLRMPLRLIPSLQELRQRRDQE